MTDTFLIASLLSRTVLLSRWEVLPSALTMMDKCKFYTVKISLLMQISEVLLCLFDLGGFFFEVRMKEMIRLLKECIFKRKRKKEIYLCVHTSLFEIIPFSPTLLQK